MSRLDELIAELCPNGVEYKVLEDVCSFVSGFAFKSALFSDEGELICKTTNIQNGEISFDAMDCFNPTDYSENFEKYVIAPQDIVIGMSGTIKVGINNSIHSCYLNQRVGKFKPNMQYLDNKFLYYLLCNSVEALSADITGGSVKNLSNRDVLKMVIPIPPLEVQQEIVHVLDAFTLYADELTDALVAELATRKKQYLYYKDELLKQKESVPFVKLKDIAVDIYRGSGIKRDQVTTEGIPCVRYGEIYTTYNTWFEECVSHTKLEYVSSPKYFEHGDILFAITGESVEDIAKSIAYLGNEKCLAGGDIVVMKHKQNSRYLAHVLSTTFAREQKSKGKVKSKVVHSNVPSIEQIEIPLPTLDVQKKYADVLDDFEQICNDLSAGITAEIEARRKQYEYYRDKLLTFKELS